jgi:hypothetical protein
MKPKLPGKIQQAKTFREKQQLGILGKTVSPLEWAALAYIEFPEAAKSYGPEMRQVAINQVCERLLLEFCMVLENREYETLIQLAKTLRAPRGTTAADPIRVALELWKRVGIPGQLLPAKELAEGLNASLGYEAVDVANPESMNTFRRLLRTMPFPFKNEQGKR